MNLTPNFTIEEFERSRKAKELGIRNKMGSVHIANATLLCVHVFEPLRKHVNKPVTITSGFRCLALNEATRGAKTSQHNEGKAADTVVEGVTALEVFKWIIFHTDFDQCIYETDHDTGAIWVHVSYNGAKNRHQTLRGDRRGGETIYKPFKG